MDNCQLILQVRLKIALNYRIQQQEISYTNYSTEVTETNNQGSNAIVDIGKLQ